MSVINKIIFLILKSVADNKVNSELTKELIGVSIDGVSEFGINKLKDFINGEKSNIDNILSEDNMQSMNIPKENMNYVVFEIKDLFSRIEITDDVLKQCKYDNMNLSAFLWNEYCKSKDDYIDCEREIKWCLFAVADALIELVRKSKDFEKDILIQISNSVDDSNIGLQKISENMKVNFDRIDDNSQMVLNILLMILQQIQKMNMQDNETKNTTDERKKFKNNKKEDYIKNWNNRLFLHIDDKNPITLADAFIMPDFEMDKSIKRIGFSDNDTLDQIIEKFVGFDRTSTLLITGVPGIGKSSLTAWIADKYKDDDRVIVLRFRDWKKSLFLKNSLLDIICDKLDCEEKDLDNKVLILDGFDEMKALNIRDRLLNEFFANINDFDNFKCIITSRSGYIIDLSQFDNVLELKKFDIKRVEDFVKIITGDV